MSVLTLRIPNEKHERLRRLAESRGMSMNRLVDEWATVALTQFDAEVRFRTLAARGSAAAGLRVLDRADEAERGARKRPRGSLRGALSRDPISWCWPRPSG
ncbi:MAG: toxin-antitoxin system HicB family antitoxin [Acidobacteria bacterium]|nr:toxin-antitoxin system HicB family antitoxin [Acidobacteriota bacterium]